MSVDNNAILFVGLPYVELKSLGVLSNNVVDIDDLYDRFGDLDLRNIFPIDFKYSSNDPIFKDFGYHRTSGFHETNDGYLIGYLVGDSGVYGNISIPDCSQKICKAELKFQTLFGVNAKTYLFNYQH